MIIINPVKISAFVLCLVLMSYGCSRQNKFEYFKVLSLYEADPINIYNKGVGLSMYAYYNPKTDSLIFRDLVDVDPYKYKTLIGTANNSKLIDTFQLVINILKRYKNGIMYDTIYDGSVYCGPVAYVEFKDQGGVHFNEFILSGNDTLDAFLKSIYKFERLFKEKKLVTNNAVNVDSEAVAAMKNLKTYDQIETPYIPLTCKPEIDLNKIYGSWKEIKEGSFNKEISYKKITFKKNGDYIFENIDNRKISFQAKTKFKLGYESKLPILIVLSSKRKYRILQLSDSCMKYTYLDSKASDPPMLLNRIYR